MCANIYATAVRLRKLTQLCTSMTLAQRSLTKSDRALCSMYDDADFYPVGRQVVGSNSDRSDMFLVFRVGKKKMPLFHR